MSTSKTRAMLRMPEKMAVTVVEFTAAPADDINDIEEWESKTFQTEFSERFIGDFEVMGEYAENPDDVYASERYRIRLFSNSTENTTSETVIWIGRNELNTVIAALTRAKQFVDGVRSRIDSAEITAVNAKSTQNAAA